jgi:hypothetical protein
MTLTPSQIRDMILTGARADLAILLSEEHAKALKAERKTWRYEHQLRVQAVEDARRGIIAYTPKRWLGWPMIGRLQVAVHRELLRMDADGLVRRIGHDKTEAIQILEPAGGRRAS